MKEKKIQLCSLNLERTKSTVDDKRRAGLWIDNLKLTCFVSLQFKFQSELRKWKLQMFFSCHICCSRWISLCSAGIPSYNYERQRAYYISWDVVVCSLPSTVNGGNWHPVSSQIKSFLWNNALIFQDRVRFAWQQVWQTPSVLNPNGRNCLRG